MTGMQPLITLGGILAATGTLPELDASISAIASLGGVGVLVYAVNYTIKLLNRKDEQIAARDKRIDELMSKLMDNCRNCDLTKAANKALIEDDD